MAVLPKRSEQRRRRNHYPGLEQAAGAPVVRQPKADPDWHPSARAWFRSLAKSGQSRYYEPSDWAQAVLLAAMMSRLLYADEPNAALLRTVIEGSRDLMTTEGARRRMQLELLRVDPHANDADAASDAEVGDIVRLAVAGA